MWREEDRCQALATGCQASRPPDSDQPGHLLTENSSVSGGDRKAPAKAPSTGREGAGPCTHAQLLSQPLVLLAKIFTGTSPGNQAATEVGNVPGVARHTQVGQTDRQGTEMKSQSGQSKK